MIYLTIDLDETPEDIEKMLIKKKRRKIRKNKKKERRKELKYRKE